MVTSLIDAAAGELDAAQDATVDPHCVDLPNLGEEVFRTDGGVRSLDSGMFVAQLDEELGCTPNNQIAVTYSRIDGSPMLRAGQSYNLAWPNSSGAGLVNVFGLTTPCETPFVAISYSFVVPLFAACATFAGPAQVVRMVLPTPPPFTNGVKLCETCPVK